MQMRSRPREHARRSQTRKRAKFEPHSESKRRFPKPPYLQFETTVGRPNCAIVRAAVELSSGHGPSRLITPTRAVPCRGVGVLFLRI